MGKYWNRPKRVSSWRKISVGMWQAPSDPTIYGFETVDVDDLMDYLAEVTEISGEKVTLTTFLVKAIAEVMTRYPDCNAIVVGNEVLRRENVDVFVQVAIPNTDSGQADLSGVKLKNCDRLDFVEIARKLRVRATRVREGQDEEIEQTKSLVDSIPPLLMPTVVKLIDFLTFAVPFDLDKYGVRSDPFGSAMVTSVGQFDIRQGFAPLVPASRCPLVALPGVVMDYPFAIDGKVEVRRGVQISFTMDHRVLDGYQIGQVVRMIRGMLNHPREHFPAPESWRTDEPTKTVSINGTGSTTGVKSGRAKKKGAKSGPEASKKRTPETQRS